MAAFRFSFRNQQKQILKHILVATHPADIRLRMNVKVYLCGDLERLTRYHDNNTSLEKAEFVIALGKTDNDIPEMLFQLGQDLCPNSDPIISYETGDEKKALNINDLVLKMHKITPPEGWCILWQRYYHALAQATPDAQEIFRRMAENNGLIEQPFKTIEQVTTRHFRVGYFTFINN